MRQRRDNAQEATLKAEARRQIKHARDSNSRNEPGTTTATHKTHSGTTNLCGNGRHISLGHPVDNSRRPRKRSQE
eukprot:4837536-Amphidinium_carterae.2